MYDDISQNPALYEPAYKEAVNNYVLTPLAERRNKPRPDPLQYFDEEKFNQEIWKGVGQADVMKGAPVLKNGVYTQTTLEGYDPEDVYNAAVIANQNPLKAAKVNARYDALPRDQQVEYELMAKKINTERNAKGITGLKPLTAQDAYVYKNDLEQRMHTSRKTDMQQQSAAGIGREESIRRGKFPVQLAAGMVTGTQEGYKPLVVVDPVTGEKTESKTGYLVNDKMRGLKLGENGYFAIDQVIYDPSTKTTSYTIKPAVDIDNIPEEWRQKYEAYKEKVYDDRGNVKGTAIEVLPRMKEEEFYAEVMVPVAQGNKSEFKEQDWLNYLEQEGIPYEAGNVPLARLLDNSFKVGDVTFPNKEKPQSTTKPAEAPKKSTGSKNIEGF
jgi:hypothetical protein